MTWRRQHRKKSPPTQRKPPREPVMQIMVKDLDTNYISAVCKKGEHWHCYSLKCQCDCGHV